MSTLSADTAPDVERRLIEKLRAEPPQRKLEMIAALNRSVRRLAVLGLEQRYPDANATEIRRRLADLLLGPDLAARAYGPLPPPERRTGG